MHLLIWQRKKFEIWGLTALWDVTPFCLVLLHLQSRKAFWLALQTTTLKIEIKVPCETFALWARLNGMKYKKTVTRRNKSGRAVARLVVALRYKPEGYGFDSQCCHWNFSLIQSFRPHYGPGVDSATNWNEYHGMSPGRKSSRCLGLTTLPPLCALCLQICEPQPPGTLWAC